MPFLVIAFVVVPIVELAVIGAVGDRVGLGPTLVLLLVDSVVGAVLVRREGRRAWSAFRETISSGRWPGDEVAQGALVLVGGALLVTPGFVTDAVGLAFVLPPTRAVLSRFVRSRLRPMGVGFPGAGPRPPGPGPGGGRAAGRVRRGDRRRHGGRRPDDLEVEVVSIERDRSDEPPDSSGGSDRPTS